MAGSDVADILSGNNARLEPGGRDHHRHTQVLNRLAARLSGGELPGAGPAPPDVEAAIRDHLADPSGPSPIPGGVTDVAYGEGLVTIWPNGACHVYSRDRKRLWMGGPNHEALVTDIGRQRGFDLNMFLEDGLTWQPSGPESPVASPNGSSGPGPAGLS